MKNFIAYFTYYLMPNIAIFTILSSIYFLFSYPLDASVKLGIIYGFIISLFSSTILAMVAMSKQTVQTYASKQEELRRKEKERKEEDKKTKKIEPIQIVKTKEDTIDKENEVTLFILMHENLAFDVLVQIVVENDSWNIEARDKEKIL